MKIQLDSGNTFEAFPDSSILSVLKKNNIWLTASCGGKGVCGKCKVKIIEGEVSAPYGNGKISDGDIQKGYVLACKVYPETDLFIDIPQESRLVVGDKIAASKAEEMLRGFKDLSVPIEPLVKSVTLDISSPSIADNTADLDRIKLALMKKSIPVMIFHPDFVRNMSNIIRESQWDFELIYVQVDNMLPKAISIASREFCNRHFGLAIDIGTTTVVVCLVNTDTAEVIDTGSTYNSQMRYGDDVITRIVHAVEGGGLQELQNAVVSDINTIVQTILATHTIDPCEVDSVSIAGNTVMSHIFWGITPAYIREEPYIPSVNKFPIWTAGDVNLKINKQAPVFTAPCMASYVGGDIAAGILAVGMHRNHEITLFMDIGTNGEIAIGNCDWLMTAACSAGPCFEGSGIHSGMRATQGAIESIKIDRETKTHKLTVVGNVQPIGICGSGMIEAIAEMFFAGIIDLKGKLIANSSPNVKTGEHGLEYVFYKDAHRKIVLTEPDIDNLIRAKAAIYSGISTLLVEAGLDLNAIEKIYIAGGFGSYLNIEKAIIIGMLPDVTRDKFRYMGNTSLTGAYMCLISSQLRKEIDEIASKMTYIELSVSNRFMDEYMSSLFLPHTDITKFPSVKNILAAV